MRTSYPSVLLMESHGLAPNVRSTSFSSINVWSKLYQSGPYFVDLMLTPGGAALELRGELIAESSTVPSEATITLIDHLGAAVATTTAQHGSFNLEIERAGSYLLDLTTPTEQFILQGIDV